MIKKILSFLLFPSLSFAVLQPGTPEVVSVSNASAFKLRGFCNAGGGDVDITFGSLSFSATCNGVTGTYNFEGDVSAETSTNPIVHCAEQPLSSTVCSRPVDNTLAAPGGSFDVTPLPSVISANESSYSVSGLCAPSGATLSLTLGAVAGVLSGSCQVNNKFTLVGDVSGVSDGVGLTASLDITSGSTTTITTTFDKDTAAADPFPTVAGVTASFTDADSDTWLEASDSATISVQFSEPVNVTGGVELDVALTSGIKSLSYVAGTGTDTINFDLPILANDEQCNGLVTIRGVDLNGGSIASVATGELASYALLSSDVQIEKIDARPPEFLFTLSLDDSFTTPTSSPEISSSGLRGEDNCVLTNLEASIGQSVGGTEVTPFLPVPISAVSSYKIQDGVDGYSFTLATDIDHFINLRAVDDAGNVGIASSSPWVLAPVFTIPDLIVYLDAMEPTSVLDGAGNISSSGAFDGFVSNFVDSSASPVVHDFTTSGASEPAFDGVANALLFDQTNDCLATPNHPEINTATVTQRSFSGVFTMGADISTRQMIFEEGANVRGMNLYVDGGDVYCGFWNQTDDGDGFQAFVSQSAPVVAGETYNITSVFDYTNYAGPAGPNGTFNCYINGVSMGAAASITSRLFAHGGDVRLGCNGSSTITHTGTEAADRNSGVALHEFMMFNSPPDATGAFDLHTYLQSKWGY